jgi:hypothetical protein
MRITPNQPRLRTVALACWAFGSGCMIYGARLAVTQASLMFLIASIEVLGLMAIAVGIAFWLLSNDRRAGIIFDAKGLLLNLGHSSSFVAWENIERVGVTTYRSSLFDLGSRYQAGLALRDASTYAQTYEQRLPATRGVLARALRLIDRMLSPFRTGGDQPLMTQLAFFRVKTGYDVLIPEALLGGKAQAFTELLEAYRLRPEERRTLDGMTWAS